MSRRILRYATAPATSSISLPLCRTLKHLRCGPLGRRQPDGAHRLPEIAQDRISSVRVKFDPYQDCFNSSCRCIDRNDKQKTGFFDSIGQTERNDHVSSTSALHPTSEESVPCRHRGLVARYQLSTR
jgi:hypothetical protein